MSQKAEKERMRNMGMGIFFDGPLQGYAKGRACISLSRSIRISFCPRVPMVMRTQ